MATLKLARDEDIDHYTTYAVHYLECRFIEAESLGELRQSKLELTHNDE